jgi:uncharacterized protein
MPAKTPNKAAPKSPPPKSGSKPSTPAERKAQRQSDRTPPPGWENPLAPQQPLVSGRWLISAILGTVAFAAVCAYLTLCLLFYQGQWQVVFHPSRAIPETPATVGLKYDAISFDYTGTGAAQLTGWWVPADSVPAGSGPTNSTRTLLFLHDGNGSLPDVAAQLKTLHSLGLNIFAFDYRGFGQSMNTHPSETRVYEDADAAWNYLVDIRHLDPRSIILYGTGLGATIAAETALRHQESPALILENPAPPALSLIAADERTSILPVRWLFADRFEIGPKLDKLGVELSEPTQAIVLGGKLSSSPETVSQENPNPSGPKFLLFLGSKPIADPHYLPTLKDFLAVL